MSEKTKGKTGVKEEAKSRAGGDSRSLGLILAGVIVVAIVGFMAYRQLSGPRGPVPVPTRDPDGWYLSIAAAKEASGRDAGEFPIAVIVTRGSWGGYEKATFEDPDVAAVLKKLRRVRIDAAAPDVRNAGLEPLPGLVLLSKEGRIVTALRGASDISVVRRALERSLQFPVPFADLKDGDPEKHLRYIEVLVDIDSVAAASKEAERYLTAAAGGQAVPRAGTDADLSRGAEKNPLTAHGRYLYAYSSAEAGDLKSARAVAEKYLVDFPDGEDRNRVRWILFVMNARDGNSAAAEKLVAEVLADDPNSHDARQITLGYAMQFLAEMKRDPERSEKFLSERIEAGGKWKNDFLMARALLRGSLGSREKFMAGLEDLRTVARAGGAHAVLAQEKLLQAIISVPDPAFLKETISFFEELAKAAPDARIRLARLRLVTGDTTLAMAEALKAAEGDHEFADDALLLLATIDLEIAKEPAVAVKRVEELLSRFPSRETLWPSRFTRAKAIFFTGRQAEAEVAIKEARAWLNSRRFLPEPFALIAPGARPEQLSQQLADYEHKLQELKQEENSQKNLDDFLKAFLPAVRNDPGAEKALEEFVSAHPASSLADDALIELAKIHLDPRHPDIEKGMAALNRVVKSYKGSDQYEGAIQWSQELQDAIKKVGPRRR